MVKVLEFLSEFSREIQTNAHSTKRIKGMTSGGNSSASSFEQKYYHHRKSVPTVPNFDSDSGQLQERHAEAPQIRHHLE